MLGPFTTAPQRGAAVGLTASLALVAPAPVMAAELGSSAPGLTLNAEEASEVFGNLTGGIRRGAEYDGRTLITLELDTEKAGAWSGGTVHASALQIHGRNISTDNLAVLQTVTNVNAERANRLWALWYKQKLPGVDADVKIGQISVDEDFIVDDNSALFISSAMGFPTLPANDLYAGAPVYPLSALGARVQAKPIEHVRLLAGVFDDNPPAGPFFDDPQTRGSEASGTRFSLRTGALWFAEVQYEASFGSLAGTYKLGGWYDSGRFPDRRFDTAGLSLAAPDSTGMPRLHRGDYSIYAIADQTLWQHGDRKLSGFARAMGAPADRNLVDFSFDAGVVLAAPFEGRKDDQVGLGYGLANVSGRAAALDRDTGLFLGTPYPVRSREQFIELTYAAQITSHWQLQPDFQYVIDPGGGIPNPAHPARRIGDEAIVGLRTTFKF